MVRNMASVAKNSYIEISRTIGSDTVNIQNGKFFRGYVYNMSLEVGYNGNPTSLVLNLTLNRTLNKVRQSDDARTRRRADIRRVEALIQNQKKAPVNQVGNLGNTGTGSYLGVQNDIARIADRDFNINPNYMGVNCSYDIVIKNGDGQETYSFKNFKITSFSISKRDDQKILTLSLQDNSFVLNKIYVGLLGQEVAIDSRSEADAIVNNIKMSCPRVGISSAGGEVTLNNLKQTLHFSNSSLRDKIRESFKNVEVKTRDLEFISGDEEDDKANYIIIKSKNRNKDIFNGYGAVILLGEEEFKDAPCAAAEVSYEFGTLKKAVIKLGIELKSVEGADGFKDKSNGKLRKNYHGTLKQVLNQWCQDFAYSYCVDFKTSNKNKLVLHSVDLASSYTKEALLSSKLNLENAEANQSATKFVIKSEDLSYDLSAQQSKIYSSFYFKDARERQVDFEKDLGFENLYNINLQRIFPQLFGNRTTKRDFSGSFRTYRDVLTSAILGKYSPSLRAIYNYSIGAYEALGFLPIDFGSLRGSEVAMPNDKDLIFSEGLAQVLNYSSENLFTGNGDPCYNMHLGFYNQELAESVLEMENFIADFVGRYFWTDEADLLEGELGNEEYYTKYEVTSSAPVEKVLAGQLYNLDVFKKARYLINSIASVFSAGTANYFKAYNQIVEASSNVLTVCAQASDALSQLKYNSAKLRKYRFFHERTGSAYGAYQEFIENIQKLDITISSRTTSPPVKIDLGKTYAPEFIEMTPVSLGALQAVLPININNVSFGSFRFVACIGVRREFQIFSFLTRGRISNPIEIQNSIYARCSSILNIASSGKESNVARNLQACNQTVLYQTCIEPYEQSVTAQGEDDSINFAAGPSPYSCFAVRVRRLNSKILDNFILNSIYTASNQGGNLRLDPLVSGDGLRVQDLRRASSISYNFLKRTLSFETIVAPSQASYNIRLISKTTSKYFNKFQNFIKGGLEDPLDVLNIVNNENFSLQLDVQNITPNLRELYTDETNASYVSPGPIEIQSTSPSPMYIEYQGYESNDPTYAFTTFNEYHNALRNVYDSKNSSFSEPNLKFNADIFCSEITSDLDNTLSINNGLTKLSINLGEDGLNLNCSFESSPAAMESLESLILRNRPNIKLINTNIFQ